MQRKHACSRERKKRDTHGQRRWRKNNLTVIYQVIVIFVYDAHLQCVRMNVGWAGAWHVLDLAGDCECDAFKLHFFLDCCFVLFVCLSNGYARIIAMMITGQANIVFFLFLVRALGIGWLQKLRTPFTPFHFETIFCCCCYFVQLQFILHSQQVYSKFVSFHMLFYAFIRYSAKTRLLKIRANNMRLIEWTDLLVSFVSKYNLHLFSQKEKTICSMLLMQFVSVTALPLFIYKRGKKELPREQAL